MGLNKKQLIIMQEILNKYGEKNHWLFGKIQDLLILEKDKKNKGKKNEQHKN